MTSLQNCPANVLMQPHICQVYCVCTARFLTESSISQADIHRSSTQIWLRNSLSPFTKKLFRGILSYSIAAEPLLLFVFQRTSRLQAVSASSGMLFSPFACKVSKLSTCKLPNANKNSNRLKSVPTSLIGFDFRRALVGKLSKVPFYFLEILEGPGLHMKIATWHLQWFFTL